MVRRLLSDEEVRNSGTLNQPGVPLCDYREVNPIYRMPEDKNIYVPKSGTPEIPVDWILRYMDEGVSVGHEG